MIVVIDTNSLVGMLKTSHSHHVILLAWLNGQFDWAISNEILSEYTEVLTELAGQRRVENLMNLMEQGGRINGNLLHIAPTYRFQTIPGDRDDDKFADCAIVAHASFIITQDRHFRHLAGSGYKPQPITPDEFIIRFLTP